MDGWAWENLSALTVIFLWMGEHKKIQLYKWFYCGLASMGDFAGKKFIVWSCLSWSKLQILSPHSVLKLDLQFKKVLVGPVRVQKLMEHFFKIRQEFIKENSCLVVSNFGNFFENFFWNY